jgi:hypothetical protein
MDFERIDLAHWEYDGRVFLLRTPATAMDVLNADVFLLSHLQSEVSAFRLAQLVRWCAEHCDNATAEDIDELGVVGVLAMRNAIIDCAGLPGRALEAVQRYYSVMYSGGCECAVCKGSDRLAKLTPEQLDRVKATCLFAGVTDNDKALADVAYTLEGVDVLRAPWWMYQLHVRRLAGINRGQADRAQKEADARKAKEALEARGLWRRSSSHKR